MALESGVHDWYVGEDKMFRWTVLTPRDEPVNTTDWLCEMSLYRRREPVPLVTVPVVIYDGLKGIVQAPVSASVTTLLGAGSYRAILARVDPGFAQVLAEDDLVLKARGV